MNQLNQTLADVFRVSPAAAFYRMKTLGLADERWKRLQNGMLVCSS